MHKTPVQSLSQENPLEEGIVTHSSNLAWEIPWMEEPGCYSPWGPKEWNMTEQLTFSPEIPGLVLDGNKCCPEKEYIFGSKVCTHGISVNDSDGQKECPPKCQGQSTKGCKFPKREVSDKVIRPPYFLEDPRIAICHGFFPPNDPNQQPQSLGLLQVRGRN